MRVIVAEIVTNDGVSHWYTQDLISAACSENAKDSDLTPKTGVIEQSASLRIYDRDDYFRINIMKNTANFFRGATVNFYAREHVSIATVCGPDVYVSNDLTVGQDESDNDINIGSYIIDKVEM